MKLQHSVYHVRSIENSNYNFNYLASCHITNTKSILNSLNNAGKFIQKSIQLSHQNYHLSEYFSIVYFLCDSLKGHLLQSGC